MSPSERSAESSKTKLLPPACLLIALVAIGLLHMCLPVRHILSFPWRLLGLVPLALGVMLNLHADAAFKRHQTTVKPFERSTALVTTGSYRLSRHPMYLGFVLILLGVAGLLGSLTPFCVAPAFALWMDRAFIRTEERMLREAFGEDWTRYAARVQRWI